MFVGMSENYLTFLQMVELTYLKFYLSIWLSGSSFYCYYDCYFLLEYETRSLLAKTMKSSYCFDNYFGLLIIKTLIFIIKSLDFKMFASIERIMNEANSY